VRNSWIAAAVVVAVATLAEGALTELSARRAPADGPRPPEVLPTDRQAVVAFARGNRAHALALARKAVDESPDEAYPLALLADLSWRAGHATEAQEAFRKLRPLSAAVDLDVPLFQRLTPIARSLALPADWRVRPASPRRGPGH
jgi:Flp pilus assembly protein TadD